jgi:hypothetical protein
MQSSRSFNIAPTEVRHISMHTVLNVVTIVELAVPSFVTADEGIYKPLARASGDRSVQARRPIAPGES